MKITRPQFLEGSQAVALTIANLEVDVVSAYPITPQTHIVENLALFKAENKANYEFLKAESEFAAASILIGASAAGGRTYSATSSQGVLLMMEPLYNAAGLRLPLVITIANRSVSAPINIFNDHSDAMAMKDSGWLMFFAENHQETVNLHVLAYKLAEQLELPVAVNIDGFIITHAYEGVSIPDKKTIKTFLPPYRPASGTYLDTRHPITLGGFFSPKHYSQARRELSGDLQKAQTLITKEHKAWQKIFPNSEKKSNCFNNGLIEYCGPAEPEKILIAMGSVCGTIKEVLKKNKKVGLIKIISFRPFPTKSLNKIIPVNCQLAILEKSVPTSTFASLYTEIVSSLTNFKGRASNHIIGLGGEDVSEIMIQKIINLNNKKEVKFW